VGNTATYTVTVSNAGPDSASNVTMDDKVPEVLSVVSFSQSQGSCNKVKIKGQDHVQCSLGTLASGASATITIVVHLDKYVDGTLKNVATTTSDTPDPNPDNNTFTLRSGESRH